MQKILIIAAIVIVIAGAWFIVDKKNATEGQMATNENTVTTNTDTSSERRVVSDGSYAVQVEESTMQWAGKKPLIEGYVNSGSFALKDGNITVADDSATGMFTIDMNTLSVSETPTKPGQESALEGHLKGERWFNVATYPEASFTIVEVTPRADSSSTFTYDVRGDLTMKGQTHELTFPATIYEDNEGKLHAEADFEFDRTQWGITSGSGSFFDNLADNVIDDNVALSFNLIAEKQ